MFASSVEVLGAAKSTIITINPLENVLPSGYDIGGVHQIISPTSNSESPNDFNEYLFREIEF